jgi:hypothetical protein
VTVRVERPNQTPVLTDDTLITPVNTPATIAMLANDNDPDGDALKLVGLGLPQQGTLALNPDRTLTYTPKAGFAGTDGFTYTVNDGWVAPPRPGSRSRSAAARPWSTPTATASAAGWRSRPR